MKKEVELYDVRWFLGTMPWYIKLYWRMRRLVHDSKTKGGEK